MKKILFPTLFLFFFSPLCCMRSSRGCVKVRITESVFEGHGGARLIKHTENQVRKYEKLLSSLEDKGKTSIKVDGKVWTKESLRVKINDLELFIDQTKKLFEAEQQKIF